MIHAQGKNQDSVEEQMVKKNYPQLLALIIKSVLWNILENLRMKWSHKTDFSFTEESLGNIETTL